jgi:2'-5' RNA ligase
MRLFVSVGVDGLEAAIAGVQTPLRGLSGLRTSDPANAHVTLNFLGEGDHDLDALTEAIEAAIETADVGPFDATLEGVGAFPSPSYIRVIWLGVGDGAGPLTALHNAIEAETTALGYEAKRHDFTPHVTLARMKHAGETAEVRGFLETQDPEVGPFAVETVRLNESTLSADGPAYRTKAEFEL